MNLRKSGINVTLEDLMNKNQEEIIRYLTKIPLKINGEIVKYLDSQIYNKRYSSIGLTGICKEDGIRYALNAGKSIDLGSEIRKFWRIINSLEKQEENYDYGRWYKIIHNYTDFEILIICVDVSEEEALLNETVWTYQNNANFKFHIMEQKFKTWEHMTIGCNIKILFLKIYL